MYIGKQFKAVSHHMKHRCACLGDPDEMAAARQAEISDRGKFVTLELTPVPKNTLTQCVCRASSTDGQHDGRST